MAGIYKVQVKSDLFNCATPIFIQNNTSAGTCWTHSWTLRWHLKVFSVCSRKHYIEVKIICYYTRRVHNMYGALFVLISNRCFYSTLGCIKIVICLNRQWSVYLSNGKYNFVVVLYPLQNMCMSSLV